MLLVCPSKISYNCFSHQFFVLFCFLIILVLLMLELSALSLVTVISLPLLFLCCLHVIVTMHRRFLERWRFLFHIIFLTHTVSLHHLWDLRFHLLLYRCSFRLDCFYFFSIWSIDNSIWVLLRWFLIYFCWISNISSRKTNLSLLSF